AYLRKNPVDKIICCGDLTGYGPNPKECIALIKSLKNAECLMGNHDLAVIEPGTVEGFNADALKALEINVSMLDDNDREFIRSFKTSISENNTLFVHGSPNDPVNEYLFLIEKYEENVQSMKENICINGHTHQPIVYEWNGKESGFYNVLRDPDIFNLEKTGKYIINAGSVGQPRDNKPAACVVFYDSKNLTVTFKRIPYDVSKTMEKMKSLGMPEKLYSRLAIGV
ncbi:MAG TPA: metallophosphatase family protein, partial [bacterium]|nr:metallophosphatase family protein [bacterium]